MSESIGIEMIGYLGSFFIVTSLMMTKIRVLRLLNLCGCFLYVIYGFMIMAMPVVAMNAGLAVINIYHLYKDEKKGSEQVVSANAIAPMPNGTPDEVNDLPQQP